MKSTVVTNRSLSLAQLTHPIGRSDGTGRNGDASPAALLALALVPLACPEQFPFLKLPEVRSESVPGYERARNSQHGMPGSASQRRPTFSGHGRRGRD